MIDQLAEVVRELERRGDDPLTARDLRRALRPVAQAAEAIREQRDFIQALQDRLLLVDALPPEAPFGALLRLRTGPAAARAPLYMGNGAGQPLTKVTPTPL